MKSFVNFFISGPRAALRAVGLRSASLRLGEKLRVRKGPAFRQKRRAFSRAEP